MNTDTPYMTLAEILIEYEKIKMIMEVKLIKIL